MEHDGDNYSNCIWCTSNGLQRVEKWLKELWIWGRIEIISTIALLRSVRIFRRILKTWLNLLTLSLQWITIELFSDLFTKLDFFFWLLLNIGIFNDSKAMPVSLINFMHILMSAASMIFHTFQNRKGILSKLILKNQMIIWNPFRPTESSDRSTASEIS